ncbi:MAG: carbon starvation protein A [Lentisphaerae bacterium]|nr:carbon starvation protein A [Lentisphaerota bacterium]
MTTLVLLAGIVVYVVLYLVYGKRLARDIVKVSDETEAPSRRLFDGVDYVPARREVLFGHHFASIAGAAPIIGPVLAMAWGWAPALLWVWFGNAFGGAVHDYLALMASVRYDGRSIQFVASDVISRRTGRIFYWLVFFLLVLVIAAFGAVLGGMFVANPQVPSSYILKVFAALVLGVLMYRVKMNFAGATVIGIVLLALAIWGGTLFPLKAGYGTWMAVMFVYIIVASALPVNVLLQPRDYLNSWLLYFGLLIGAVAAVCSFKGFSAPAFTQFAPIISGGRPTPYWPAIPLVIACGSLSGFHALVGSGTTSKQIARERDALPIGYGGMLTEGLLSTLVIVTLAGFGFELLREAGGTISRAGWGTEYTAAMMQHYPKAAMFTHAYAAMVNATWLRFLPTDIVRVIAGMWVASFAMTTLDTTNRLARYCLTEICLPVREWNATLFRGLTNRWIASAIPAAIGIWLAWSGSFTMLWPSFGTANQLIASIALLTGTAWLIKRMHVRAWLALIPALLLWVTVTAAIVWFSLAVLPGTVRANPATGLTVLGIEIVMFGMNLYFMADFARSVWGRGARGPEGGAAG